MLGGSLSSLDAKRSAKLILELIELPGRWDGWTRVGALENLLLSGVSLQLDEVLKILEPTFPDLLRSRSGCTSTSEAWEGFEGDGFRPPSTQTSPADVRSNSVPRHHPKIASPITANFRLSQRLRLPSLSSFSP
jgi:hypothetical protein